MDKQANWDLYTVDYKQPDSVDQSITAFTAKHGGLDAYVHAVGGVFLKPLHMVTDEEWEEVLSLNLTSAFTAARAALKPMLKAREGVFLFFSSVAGQIGISNHEAISAAKAGISGLTRSIAATYASNGIRANAIAPGLVETPATRKLTSNEQALKISERMHPLGRIGTVDDIASLAAWMISAEASWMTGQVVGLDGGMGSIVPKPRA